MNFKYILRMSYSIRNKIFFSVSIVQWVCFLKEIKKIITDVKKTDGCFQCGVFERRTAISICNDTHAKTQTPRIYKRFWRNQTSLDKN